MDDNNKLRDTILDMEASLSTNLNGYSMWHYGADIHGITRETLKNAVEALKAQEAVEPTRKPEIFDSLYFCGKCSAKVGFQIRKDDSWRFKCNFCPNCGRAVKW